MNRSASNYLIQESPLIVLPSLAEAIGLNQAIFLQQVHFWLNVSPNERDGKRWIFNTVDDWQKQMPFWSIRTITRIIADLRKRGLIVVGKFNKSKWEHRLWYTINYEALAKIAMPKEKENASGSMSKMVNRSCQVDVIDDVKLAKSDHVKLAETYNRNNTDNTTEKKEPPSQTSRAIPLIKEYDVLLRLDSDLRSELARSPQTDDIKNLVFTVKKMLDQFGVQKIFAAWEVLQADEWYRESGYASVWYLFGDEGKAALKIRKLLARQAVQRDEEKIEFINA